MKSQWTFSQTHTSPIDLSLILTESDRYWAGFICSRHLLYSFQEKCFTDMNGNSMKLDIAIY